MAVIFHSIFILYTGCGQLLTPDCFTFSWSPVEGCVQVFYPICTILPNCPPSFFGQLKLSDLHSACAERRAWHGERIFAAKVGNLLDQIRAVLLVLRIPDYSLHTAMIRTPRQGKFNTF